MYVTSTDPNSFDPDALKQPENPDRPLPGKIRPEVRAAMAEHVYGDKSIPVKKGHLSLDQLQEILASVKDEQTAKDLQRLREREVEAAKKAAGDYGANEAHLRDLFRHYFVFDQHDSQSAGGHMTRRSDAYLAGSDWVDSREEAQGEPIKPVSIAARSGRKALPSSQTEETSKEKR